MTKDARKTLKRGKNEKGKVQEKFNNITAAVEFFTFLYMEKDIFCSRDSLRKCSLYYNIFSKAFLVLQGI